MFELIGLIVAGGAAGFGYLKTRSFFADRLRYVDSAKGSAVPVVAGVAATLVAAPVVWLLPIIGGGTALAFGAAVGLGARAGAKKTAIAPY